MTPSHLCLQDLIDHALRDRHVLNKRAHLVLNVATALELAPHRRGLDLMKSAHGVEGRGGSGKVRSGREM